MAKHRKPYINAEGNLVKDCGTCKEGRLLTDYNKGRAECRDCQTARSRAWRIENPERARELSRIDKRKQALNPKKCLETIIRARISDFLSGRAESRKTFLNLEFSGDELRSHLEAQFKGMMTWETYGRYGWHVDHIKPLSAFQYETVDDPKFKEAWSLRNIRPLWWHENLWKGARFEGDNDNDAQNFRGVKAA